MVCSTQKLFSTQIGHFMDINPWYECEKWSNLSRKISFELSVPRERAHCKLQKYV